MKEAFLTFKTKSEGMVWLRENFNQHLRTLEEAMYLAGLGKFAEKFEGIPKNSMLALGRIRYEDEVVEFMEQYPPPVVNPEDDLTPRKNYAHSVIIYKRFLDREVSLTPEQATSIATTFNKPLEINAVNLVAEQILAEPTDEKKAEFIENWVKDGCLIKHEKKEKKASNLGEDITQFKEVAKKYNLNDTKVLSEVNGDELRELYQLIWNLAQKKQISLSPPNQDGEQPEAEDTDNPESKQRTPLVTEKLSHVG